MNATTSKSRRNGPSLSAPFRQALNEWDCVGLSVSPDTRSYPGNVQLIFQSPGMSLIDPEQRDDRSGISAPAGDPRGDCLAPDGAPLGQAAIDRTSGVSGKRGSGRVDPGGRRYIKKKKK